MISDSYSVRGNVFTSIANADGTLAIEAAVAAVKDSSGSLLTVAAVYNYAPWPQVLADVQDFADRNSEGRLIVGGDFNMATALDKKKGLQHLGTVAFERIGRDFGWSEVLPGPTGTEVPTWTVGPSAGNSPRQLDHVFVKGLVEFDAECTVLVPPEADVRLSDHALLRTCLDPRAS